jgi:hypothetical protein
MRRDGYANREASIMGEIANDRLSGFVLKTVFASVVILNALAH